MCNIVIQYAKKEVFLPVIISDNLIEKYFGQKRIFYLTLLPLILIAILIFLFHVNVPFYDQWELVPLLVKEANHTLTFSDLWTPHGNHRIFFPKIIMLLLARVTGWNISYEFMVNFLLALIIFTGIIYLINRLKSNGNKKYFWLLPIFSLLIFSPNQWENWLWGWQITIFLNVATAFWGILLLSAKNLNWKRFFGSVLLGIISSFSFSCGLVFWICGLLLLILENVNKNYKKIYLFLWIILSSSVIYLYFYHFNGQFLGLGSIFSNIPGYIFYTLSFLGAPIIGLHPVPSALMGLAGMIIFAILLARLFYKRRNVHPINILLLSLGFYGIFSGLIIAFGRVNLGSIQAISSRYITIGNLFWIPVIVILFEYILNRKKSVPSKIYQVFFVLIIFSLTALSLYRIRNFQKQNIFLKNAKEELISGVGEKYLKKLYYSEKIVRQRAGDLEKYKLWVYKK